MCVQSVWICDLKMNGRIILVRCIVMECVNKVYSNILGIENDLEEITQNYGIILNIKYVFL